MKLSELVRGLPLTGDLGNDPEVFGVRHDSRAVEPGDLFLAWSGARHEGSSFAREAIARGAVAVVVDRSRPADVTLDVPWLEAAAPRALLGALAAPLHGHPESSLTLAGVTGTNGKSTTVELVAAILDAAHVPCGRIGTLGYRFPGLESPPAERTTPEASDLFRLLAGMRRLGARAAAMEVSSHALEQGRVAGLAFDVAIFTNLTRDHFDFHRDFDAYFEAKAKLFGMLKPTGRAAIGLDDAWGEKLAARVPGALGFGDRPDAAVAPERIELDERGIRGTLRTPRGPLEIDSPLLGRYNLLNVLAAVAAAEALELPPGAIVAGLHATRPIAGRMEPVEAGQAFPVVVDYAHTEAALEAALRSARELTGRPLVVVFGCGGDRDPGKRPRMGRIAGELAELPIATSDNPRTEDPQAILTAVEAGLRESGNPRYRVVPDRREAIRRAVAIAAAEGFAVVVAGKGHERMQIVGERRLPFSDREELERALGELAAGASEGVRA
jgi:UDP-N-acetylmuramoyl-L-alanyl-D-glutamate--2,6-diaminopimelate ligase